MSYGYPPYYAQQPSYPPAPVHQNPPPGPSQLHQDYAYQSIPSQAFTINAPSSGSGGSYYQAQAAPPPSQYPPIHFNQQYQSYGQPPVAPPPPVPQPQAPAYQPQLIADLNNPNIFRPFFRSGLDSLQMNSKAIIQDLTGLANQYSLRMASIIAEELEEHIRTCPPYMKLPAMYLMDSIAKNLGAPYPALFSRYMERLFLSAYREVDPSARIKLEELLGTWRTGGAGGTQLYPFNQGRLQQTLEEALFGKQGRGGGMGASGGSILDSQYYLNGLQQKSVSATPQDTIMVANDIRKVLGQRRAQQYRDPHNQSNRLSIEALEKLEHLVNTSNVTLDQIHQIREQLAALSPAVEVVPEVSAPVLSAEILSSLSGLSAADYSALLTQGPIASGSNADPGDPRALANLTNGQDKSDEQTSKEAAYKAKLFDSYDEQIRAIGLTSSEINKPKSKAHTLLYQDLPLQCTQCAARWLDTPRHKKIQQKHMDRHFRNNNRLATATRAQSRSWFIAEDEWIRPPVDETVETADDTEANDLLEIMKMRVKQPTDPAKQSRPCPICKEGFKAEWSDKDEEWFWVDARKVDRSIYHASCYAEMVKLRGPTKVATLDEIGSSNAPTPSEQREASPIEESKPEIDEKPDRPMSPPLRGETVEQILPTETVEDTTQEDGDLIIENVKEEPQTNGESFTSEASPQTEVSDVPMTLDPATLQSVAGLVQAGSILANGSQDSKLEPQDNEIAVETESKVNGLVEDETIINGTVAKPGKRAASNETDDREAENPAKRVKQETAE